MSNYSNLENHGGAHDLPGFKPLLIDDAVVESLGLSYPVSQTVRHALRRGSERYIALFENNALQPSDRYHEALADPDEELEIHNYTNICPTNVLEVTPSAGSCSIACQYCLVTDGNQCTDITLYTNYTEKLNLSLERNRHKNTFYYFSPKTDAFSEPHLVSGLAHDILRTFLRHYERFPDSRVRVFICSKAGLKVCLRRRPPSGSVLMRGRFAALQAASLAALQGTVRWRGFRSSRVWNVGGGGAPSRSGRSFRRPFRRVRW